MTTFEIILSIACGILMILVIILISILRLAGKAYNVYLEKMLWKR